MDFVLGGRAVRFVTCSDGLAAAMRSWLPGLAEPACADSAASVQIHLYDDGRFPSDLDRPVIRHGDTSFWRDPSGLIVSTGPCTGILNWHDERISVWASAGRDRATDVVIRCVRPLLSFALARHGLHGMHASAVSTDDAAILILGATGAGKSTMAGRMADLGAGFMSDDMSFIDETTFSLLGMRDRNRPRPFPGSRSNCRDRIEIARAGDTRQLPIRRVLALTRGETESPVVSPLGASDLMVWLMRSGLLGLDARSDRSRLSTLSQLAECGEGFVVALGARPPSDDTLRIWMSETMEP